MHDLRERVCAYMSAIDRVRCAPATRAAASTSAAADGPAGCSSARMFSRHSPSGSSARSGGWCR
ncbi:hypothetical protein ACFQ3Z_42995 [Streptomyces nogalater]